ncbi:hypothetical protein PRK78_003247 [Emydomyces testavorans]|uniref:Uncharacterized protein n=1 Tax=Emydomyces testavorans TaxID=2070801 RepID=A0AAF0DFU5_9EURO|nr:hypothetical protein PRK78_003247 [Emydomyces testavorans]
MFALRPSEKSTSSLLPNILPCRIHHDGAVNVSLRHWSPVTDEKNPDLATAYFRGRKLRGRRVTLPKGYHGVVALPTEKKLSPPEQNSATDASDHNNVNTRDDDEENDGDDGDVEPLPMILETQGTFSHLMVWEHETVPSADDSFVKGINEWIRFAEAMHSDTSQTESKSENEEPQIES